MVNYLFGTVFMWKNILLVTLLFTPPVFAETPQDYLLGLKPGMTTKEVLPVLEKQKLVLVPDKYADIPGLSIPGLKVFSLSPDKGVNIPGFGPANNVNLVVRGDKVSSISAQRKVGFSGNMPDSEVVDKTVELMSQEFGQPIAKSDNITKWETPTNKVELKYTRTSHLILTIRFLNK